MTITAEATLRQGRDDDAIDSHREAVGILDAHGLRNFEGSAVRSGLAEALLARAGFSSAALQMGTHQSLSRNQAGARSWWTKGLAAARTNGARYDEARIQAEIGRRTGDADATAAGTGIMDDIIARWERGA